MRTLVRHWAAAALIALFGGGAVAMAAFALQPAEVHIGLAADTTYVDRIPIHCPPHLPISCEPSVRPGPTPIPIPIPMPTEFPPPPEPSPPPPPPEPTTTTTTAPPTTTRTANLPLLTVDLQAPTDIYTPPPTTTTTPPPTSREVAAAPATTPTASTSVFDNPLVVLTLVVVVIAAGIAGGKAFLDHRR
ncbi:MAG TPA: hypothetical protein VGD84_02890, partial [Pseudonocardiaceae bacterium]